MRTLKTLAASAVVVLMAASGNAASLSDVVTQIPGGLQIVINGSGEGTTAAGLQLEIGFDNGNGAVTSFTDAGGIGFLGDAAQGTCGANNCVGTAGITFPVPIALQDVQSIYQLTGLNPGDVVQLDYSLLNYGGATLGSPGPITIVPEPTTAGLLGLGLLSLAISGRRR